MPSNEEKNGIIKKTNEEINLSKSENSRNEASGKSKNSKKNNKKDDFKRDNVETVNLARKKRDLNSEKSASKILKICQNLGKNIRIERKRRGFSTEDLAEFLELSSSYIGLLERGERCPSVKALLKICELYSITPDIILYQTAPFTGKSSNKTPSNFKVNVAEKTNSKLNDKREAMLSMMSKLDSAELSYLINAVREIKVFQKQITIDLLNEDN